MGVLITPGLDCSFVQVHGDHVPDNTRPPRALVDPDPRPTLGVRAIMSEIEELARQRGIGAKARVLYKRNAKGEHVIALIFPP